MIHKVTPHLVSTVSNTRKQAGFTIVEVAVVVFIVGILTVVGAVSYNAAQVRAKNIAAQEDLANFGRTMVRYKADMGAYPSDTNAITGAYAVKFNKALLSETSYYNLIYCSLSPYGSYALAATTKSGMKIYVKNDDAPKEYTGAVNWSTNSIASICGSVLTGSTNVGVTGFRISGGAPVGWRPWVNGS